MGGDGLWGVAWWEEAWPGWRRPSLGRGLEGRGVTWREEMVSGAWPGGRRWSGHGLEGPAPPLFPPFSSRFSPPPWPSHPATLPKSSPPRTATSPD